MQSSITSQFSSRSAIWVPPCRPKSRLCAAPVISNVPKYQNKISISSIFCKFFGYTPSNLLFSLYISIILSFSKQFCSVFTFAKTDPARSKSCPCPLFLSNSIKNPVISIKFSGPRDLLPWATVLAEKQKTVVSCHFLVYYLSSVLSNGLLVICGC